MTTLASNDRGSVPALEGSLDSLGAVAQTHPPMREADELSQDAELTVSHSAATLPDPDDMQAVADRRARLVERHGRSLRQHTARGALVNTAFLVALSTLGFIRGFVLAHFLTRADYGVWGILVVSLGTILWLKQVGIGDRYIQQDDADQEIAFQKAFTLELAFNLIFMAILAIALPIVALAYNQWKLVPPGIVLLLLLPAGALQAPFWVFYRDMEFVRQRSLQAIEPIVGFVVAVGMAAAGFGYWALAGGVLAGAWASAIVAVIASPYKLRLRFDVGTLRSYASFSWPLMIGNGASMVVAQSAVIAGNIKLGLAGVGVVALASNITVLTQRVDGLVTTTLYPAICAVRDRLDLLGESFVKSNRLALMWAMPFGVGLALFCDDLVHFLLGEKWRAAVTLLQFYGVIAAVGHIGYNWDAFMRATARTRPIAVASVASMVAFLVVGLPLLFVYGLTGLAIGVAVQTGVNLIFRAYYLGKLFDGFTYLRHASRAVIPTIPAVLAVFALRIAESGQRSFAEAVGELSVYIAITIAATWWSEKSLLREALGYVKSRGAVEATA
jgi:O-antigen/teichoic acid export membrane protein